MAQQTLVDIALSLPQTQVTQLLDDCLTIGLVYENRGEQQARECARRFSRKYLGAKRRKLFAAIAEHDNIPHFIDTILEPVTPPSHQSVDNA